MNKRSYFIAGLPEACKTTYLAALWYCLNNSKGGLEIKRFIGDHTYLSDICNKWADVKQISRTKPEFEKIRITLLLKTQNQEEFEVTFPDLSGESFQAQYTKRETTQEIADYIKQCDGILLFINPENINELTLIPEVPKELREDAQQENMALPRNPLEDPMQVQLVELLQFINYIRDAQVIKLGVIISAWDRVEVALGDLKNKPKEFVFKRLPLLWQFLESNSNCYLSYYYGISAQGGQLSESQVLLGKDPYERLIVVDEYGNRSHDISLPLSKMVSEI